MSFKCRSLHWFKYEKSTAYSAHHLSTHTISQDSINYLPFHLQIQYNLNGSNTDGSFTVDDSNSFFSPYKILPIAQENKYLGIFSYFIMELYVVCTH